MIGRWISRLDQYHFEVVHRPRTKHKNADGLSKRTNEYIKREKLLEAAPDRAAGFSFMSQQAYNELPVTSWLNKQGQPIQDHPELPPEYKIETPHLTLLSKSTIDEDDELPEIDSDCWFPESVWENSVPLTNEYDTFSFIHCMKIDEQGPQASTIQSKEQMKSAPDTSPHTQVLAILDINTELHEHISTVHGLADLRLAQN